MPELSIIEHVVYGFFAYSSMLMLIISLAKEVPTGKSLAIMRSVYVIPGILAAGVLASSGVDISFTTNTIIDLNTTEVWTEENIVTLGSPAWTYFHGMIMVVLVVFIIQQVLIIFTKHDKADN